MKCECEKTERMWPYYVPIGGFALPGFPGLSLSGNLNLTFMKTEFKSSDAQVRNLHQDLIDKCDEGDQRAQYQVYRLYCKSMYNTSLQILNKPKEAEETMKEALLSAFETINSYSGSVSFDTWLQNIVINLSLEATRKERGTILEDIN
jgi:hypothetical protein